MPGGMSQQRIDGVLSVDLRPKGFRSGKVHSAIPYLVLLKDLRKRGEPPSTWTVASTIEPKGTPGITVGFPSTVTLPPQVTTGRRAGDPEAIVYVTDGAEPGREVQVVLTFSNRAHAITVKRYFTVEPSKRRPR